MKTTSSGVVLRKIRRPYNLIIITDFVRVVNRPTHHPSSLRCHQSTSTSTQISTVLSTALHITTALFDALNRRPHQVRPLRDLTLPTHHPSSLQCHQPTSTSTKFSTLLATALHIIPALFNAFNRRTHHPSSLQCHQPTSTSNLISTVSSPSLHITPDLFSAINRPLH